MKRRLLSAAIIAALSVPCFAQSDFLTNISFGVSSYPEENGNVSDGYLSYRFTPNWSATARIKLLNSTETDILADTQASLYLKRETTTEAFLYPAEFNLDLEGVPLYASVGLYISAQGTKEVGYFDLGGSVGLNSYNNDQTTFFYGPVIELGSSFTLPLMKLYIQGTIVPYFFFKAEQNMAVEPLVPTNGEHSYKGKGFPYLALKLQPTILDYFAPDFSYEYQRADFEALITKDLGGGSFGWDIDNTLYELHTLSIRANVRLPLFDRGYAELGYGRKLSWTIPEGGEVYFANKGIFKLSFGIEK